MTLKGVAPEACLIDARLCDALFFSHRQAGDESAAIAGLRVLATTVTRMRRSGLFCCRKEHLTLEQS